MSTAKDTMSRIIAEQPDDSTYDGILRELAMARMIERGIDNSEQGRVIPDDEMKRRIDSWGK
jgi:predicted transcriptional regulator